MELAATALSSSLSALFDATDEGLLNV